MIITTGGTGVGPRDRTPEAIVAVCDKLLPGIMEHIRVKFAAENPNAAVEPSGRRRGRQHANLCASGSVCAVEQYLGEIFLTLEHLIFMLHGLDVH